jgi:hypothetical protein
VDGQANRLDGQVTSKSIFLYIAVLAVVLTVIQCVTQS